MFPIVNIHHGISAYVASGSQKHAPGDRIVYGDAEYVFMYNGSNTAITAGHFVHILTGASGWSVVQSSATGVQKPVGVNVHSQAATGEYFWGLVGGVCPRLEVTSAQPAGTFIYAAANGTGTSTQPTGLNTALGSLGYIGAVGQVVNSIAANSSGMVFIF